MNVDGAAMRDLLLRHAARRLSPAGPSGGLTILIFHRVHEKVDPLFPDDPDRARFEQLCRSLASWCHVLPLDEAVVRLEAGTLPAAATCITFDDGYRDNAEIALPILSKHRLCATFFIATDFVDGGRMWNDSLVEAVRRSHLEFFDPSTCGVALERRFALRSWEDRRALVHSLLDTIKYLEPRERIEAVARVGRALSSALPDDLMMTRAQLQDLASAGMQIGAHTQSHPILARLSDDQARTEVLGGRDLLQAWLQRPVTLFAYPNGRRGTDYTDRDVGIVKAGGFSAAVSTDRGFNRSSAFERLQLRRFTPWDRPLWRFGARLVRNMAG